MKWIIFTCRLTGANTAYCVYSPGPENMSIKQECSQGSSSFICLQRIARLCCGLICQCDIPDDEYRDSRNLPVSPSPYLTAAASATIRKNKKKNLPTRGITGVNPPPPTSRFCPRMRMRPTCRCWSGKESGASGRANRCCIWKSCRFREAKLRRGAAGVLPSSRCTSGTSQHRHTVIFGHTLIPHR